jgi:uncharacterized protein YqeY
MVITILEVIGMSLRRQLEADMKDAMRARDAERRDSIRYVLSVVKNAEIDKRRELNAEEELQLLRTQVKQRQDAIEQFRQGGRDDLAEREASQVALIETYLPKQMSDDELASFVRQGVEETGAEGPKDLGKVMGLLNKRADGRVDGRRLSAAVRDALS